MNVSSRAFLHRLLTCPILLPLMLLYFAVDHKKVVLDAFYWIRGLPHGYTKGLMRYALYHDLQIAFPFNEDPFFDDVWLRDVYRHYVPNVNDVVVDVGAHMGTHGLLFVESGKICRESISCRAGRCKF